MILRHFEKIAASSYERVLSDRTLYVLTRSGVAGYRARNAWRYVNEVVRYHSREELAVAVIYLSLRPLRLRRSHQEP